MNERGTYIVLEGHDSTGKTSQRDMLVKRINDQQGEDRAIGVHEPGETAIGLELERIIKDRELGRSAMTNLLLFTANRLELLDQIINPALAEGKIIIADRNWLSSAAYQGYAEGLGIGTVRNITREFCGENYMQPDLTIILHASNETRLQRLGKRGDAHKDTFESRSDEFQQKILKGYDEVTPTIKNLVYISADPTKEEVHEQIWAAYRRAF
ncbi:MAG TPA: dTMP kinase [Candidatus Saccharimonadales bacterium]|jgi:dTMP kinase|nr:dTMP kinase [Candidatus Saccharimonadales bacterium]